MAPVTNMRYGVTEWYLVILGQYRVVLVDICWYWVSTGRYWLVLGGIGSVERGTGWNLVVLGQHGAELVTT